MAKKGKRQLQEELETAEQNMRYRFSRLKDSLECLAALFNEDELNIHKVLEVYEKTVWLNASINDYTNAVGELDD